MATLRVVRVGVVAFAAVGFTVTNAFVAPPPAALAPCVVRTGPRSVTPTPLTSSFKALSRRRAFRVNELKAAELAAPGSSSPPAATPKPTAVYALITATFVTFILDNILRLPVMKAMYLYHSGWAWWQPLTSVFCHGSRDHLSGNVFLLLLFGRSVEDDWV